MKTNTDSCETILLMSNETPEKALPLNSIYVNTSLQELCTGK